MLQFKIALQPLIDALVDGFPRLPLNTWYAGDGTPAIFEGLALAVLSFPSTQGESGGFHINMTETQAWCPALPPSSDPDVRNLQRALISEPSPEILGVQLENIEHAATRYPNK